MTRSRIAPTPSGYLHIGNALNFVLTYAMVQRSGGSLRLRIDDIDAPRARLEYIEDIFETLHWMGIDWDAGPQTPEQHYTSFSQSLRAPRYRQVIDALNATGQTYACTCSRRDLDHCQCRTRCLPLNTPDTALRIVTPYAPVQIDDRQMGVQYISLRQHMPDFVIRRRDGIAAYQLASLIDDIDYGIDLVVRGADLLPSTAAQLFLASLIGEDGFGHTAFYHHALLTDANGSKLSKSAGSDSLRSMRRSAVSASEFYLSLSRMLKIDLPAHSLAELVSRVKL